MSGIALYRSLKFLRYEIIAESFGIIVFKPRNEMKSKML